MPTRRDMARPAQARTGLAWLAGLALVGFTLGAAPAIADPGEPEAPAPRAQLAPELREMIERLDDADPGRRLEAERSLAVADGFGLAMVGVVLREHEWTPEQRQRLMSLAAQLFARHERAALGIQMQEINGMVRVTVPQPGFPAARVLRPNDFLEAIDGRPILADPAGRWTAIRELQVEIISRRPGEHVVLTVLRDGERLHLPCTFGHWTMLNNNNPQLAEDLLLDAWRRFAEREGILPSLAEARAGDPGRVLDASAPPGSFLTPEAAWSEEPDVLIPTRRGSRAPAIAVLGADRGWHEVSMIRGSGLVQTRPGVLMPERADARIQPRNIPGPDGAALELQEAAVREIMIQRLEQERMMMLIRIENIAGEQERMTAQIRRGTPHVEELEAQIQRLDAVIVSMQTRVQEIEAQQRELRGQEPIAEP